MTRSPQPGKESTGGRTPSMLHGTQIHSRDDFFEFLSICFAVSMGKFKIIHLKFEKTVSTTIAKEKFITSGISIHRIDGAGGQEQVRYA